MTREMWVGVFTAALKSSAASASAGEVVKHCSAIADGAAFEVDKRFPKTAASEAPPVSVPMPPPTDCKHPRAKDVGGFGGGKQQWCPDCHRNV